MKGDHAIILSITFSCSTRSQCAEDASADDARRESLLQVWTRALCLTEASFGSHWHIVITRVPGMSTAEAASWEQLLAAVLPEAPQIALVVLGSLGVDPEVGPCVIFPQVDVPETPNGGPAGQATQSLASTTLLFPARAPSPKCICSLDAVHLAHGYLFDSTPGGRSLPLLRYGLVKTIKPAREAPVAFLSPLHSACPRSVVRSHRHRHCLLWFF
jgi:hypothetical protein